MFTEIDILKIVVKRLKSAGIPYMITGSIAANFYTVPRMTRDLDIVIEVSEGDVERLFELFSGDFYIDKDSVNAAVRNRRMFNIIHNEGIVKVDFIIRKDVEYRKAEFENRRRMGFEDIEVFIVSPEDLIISKLYWAKDSLSELQLRDVKNLFDGMTKIDKAYIEKWVVSLGLQEIYGKVK